MSSSFSASLAGQTSEPKMTAEDHSLTQAGALRILMQHKLCLRSRLPTAHACQVVAISLSYMLASSVAELRRHGCHVIARVWTAKRKPGWHQLAPDAAASLTPYFLPALSSVPL